MTKSKNIISREYSVFRNEISTPEYAIWWLMRIGLAVVLVKVAMENLTDIRVIQIFGNLLATFTVFLVRIIFRSPESMFRRLTYRCQTWINLTAFLTAFFGQGLDFYHVFSSWDKVLHFITGGTFVLIGSELVTMLMKENDRISAANRTFSAMGFSYFAMVAWELIEFFFDYFIEGSALQRYEPGDADDCLNNMFTMIFGQSVNEGRIEDGLTINHWPLFDTAMDLFYAMVCCVAVGIGLYTVLKRKEKKERMSFQAKEEITC
ncbi:MAG: hypothetical protein IKV21_01315 [Clostridia bacterium]|nr:hypothetical protein [Clostridia bacterium]